MNYDGCAGKLRFDPFARAARVASRKRRNQNERFAAYACEICCGFHVGSHLGSDRDGHKTGMVPRQPFAVYASKDDTAEVLVGWSATADGAGVAKVLATEPGWRVTRVIERKRRAA